MEKGYLDTPHGQVHFRMEGAGEPVLLLHQTPRSSRMYAVLAPLLAERYTVLALDTLGAGSSDPLPPNAQIVDVARSVVDALDLLKVQRSHIFGIHSGAALAAEIAAGWPSRLDKLILFGFLAVAAAEREAALSERSAGMANKFKVVSDGSHLTSMWSWAYMQIVRTWWNTQTLPNAKLAPEAAQYLERCLLDLAEARSCMEEMHRAVFKYDWESRLPLIQARTLLIEGTGAFESALSRRAERLSKLIPRSTVAQMSGADANVAEWRAPELADTMIAFLRQDQPARRGPGQRGQGR